MGAKRYSCENIFRAIRLLLWHTDSHNMAIFTHFLAFLVIFLDVTTTVMLTLGISRTQTLVTHMGLWCGAIFALSRHPSRTGEGWTGLIFEGKWPYYGYLCAIVTALWLWNYFHMNIYWHPWFGAIFTTFGYLEVSFVDNSFIVYGRHERSQPLCKGFLMHFLGTSTELSEMENHSGKSSCQSWQ